MSPASGPNPAPASPAARRARPERGRHRWIALLLVLAALFGAGAAATLPGGGAEFRSAAFPASDPGGETHDPASTEAGLAGRGRRHGTGLRPIGSRPGPHRARGLRWTPAPVVPAPRGDALRRVVMRC
ncbi:hypothetical protein ACGFYZ_32745 [Streptomyces sp. NPDC048330]|uniref:hypothetical protein n=1 Tax=Streptomyces sp. NPDC048330 TaxID=3365533 RepID=UPI00371DAE7F